MTACSPGQEEADTLPATSPSAEVQEDENARYYAFVEQVFNDAVDRSPSFQAWLGIKKDIDKWDDNSEEHALAEHEINKQSLRQLAEFDYDALDERARLSYDLFRQETERYIREFAYRDHTYPINTMYGAHTQIPAFLMNFHRIDELADAEAYIKRIDGVGAYVDQLIVNLRRRQEAGIVPPKFVFPIVLQATQNVITGVPFTESEEDSPVFANFKEKLDTLALPRQERLDLIARAGDALTMSFKPAYEKLLAFLRAQEKIADTDDGVWKFPDGGAFYKAMLARYTTTELSAEEIHQIGLDNVARIHDEMRTIMTEVGFDGSLQDFFRFMREDERFYYPNTDEGRKEYLATAVTMIDEMEAKIPDYFGLLPRAKMEVKRVEPFRERSSGKAFYQSPSQDGARPRTLLCQSVRHAADAKISNGGARLP